MKRALKALFFIIALVAVGGLLSGTVAWDGSWYTTVRFELRDDETDRPLQDALIFAGGEGLRSFDSVRPDLRESYLAASPYIGRTNSDGVATVSFHSRAGGGTFLFWRTGRYHVEEEIIIRAEGYEESRSLAQNLLGRKTFSIRRSEHETRVYLKKKKNKLNQ